MQYFVTGAGGFIGKAVIKELTSHGHTVLGLVRSDKSAELVTSLGAQVLRGDLDDLASLTKGAAASDGVVHLAFVHDFSDFPACCSTDRAAIQALAEGLAGTGKPLVIASGTLMAPRGIFADEDTPAERNHPPFSERALSADLLFKLSKEKGFRSGVVRLSPTVHGNGDGGMVPGIVAEAKKSGFVPVPKDLTARWPAVHRDDAASLFRLILEKGRDAATYTAVAEFEVKARDILVTISEKLSLPLEENATAEKMYEGLGFYGHVIVQDNPTSSEKTQKELGWKPVGPTLLDDMKANYFSA